MEKNCMQEQMSENNPLTIIKSFRSCGFHDILLKNLLSYKIFNPTLFQRYALSIVMSGRDLMASGPTGCEKTVTYCLPILHYLLNQQLELIFDEKHCEPHIIIMAPKNKFVAQICNLLYKFKRGTHIRFSYLYEGKDVAYQRSAILKNGNHIIVATPRSLKDCVDNNFVSFKSVKILVIDYADKMLHMGLTLEIEQLLKHPTMTSNDIRQTLMFSSIFSSEIHYLTTFYLKPDYTLFGIGDVGAMCKDVEQTIQEVKEYDKKKTLLSLLNKMEDGENAIVYVEGQQLADHLVSYCSETNIPTTSFHEDSTQTDREEALNNFKTNKMKVLIGTTVLARGLDIEDVNYVVNYDLPKTIGEYIHRIGCFGRLGNVGKAISFFDPERDGVIAPDLIKILQQAKQEIPIWLWLKKAKKNCKVESADGILNELKKPMPVIVEDQEESQ